MTTSQPITKHEQAIALAEYEIRQDEKRAMTHHRYMIAAENSADANRNKLRELLEKSA